MKKCNFSPKNRNIISTRNTGEKYVSVLGFLTYGERIIENKLRFKVKTKTPIHGGWCLES